MYLRTVIVSFLSLSLLLIPLHVLPGQLAQGAQLVTVAQPTIRDASGRSVSQVDAGEQVVLLTSILNGGDADQPFIAILDVRNGAGASVHIAWMEGVARHGELIEVRSSGWAPLESGSFDVRTFVITGFEGPEVLSETKSASISVVAPASERVSGIANFAVLERGSVYEAWFGLLDTDLKETAYDGKASLSLTDSLGEVLYSGSVPVTKDDFQLFKRSAGTPEILAYKWEFKSAGVKEGVGEGTAKLTFTTNEGVIYTAMQGPVELPQLTGSAIVHAYDLKYRRHATGVDATVVEGDYKVALEGAGHFTYLSNGTSGNEVTHYRVDFVITNLASDHRALPSEFLIVDSKSKQYNPVSGGTLLTGTSIHPYSTLKGYMLFDDVDKDTSSIKVVMKVDNPGLRDSDIIEFTVFL